MRSWPHFHVGPLLTQAAVSVWRLGCAGLRGAHRPCDATDAARPNPLASRAGYPEQTTKEETQGLDHPDYGQGQQVAQPLYSPNLVEGEFSEVCIQYRA